MALVFGLAVVTAVFLAAAPTAGSSAGPTVVADDATEYVIVRLQQEPVATYAGGIPGLQATKPAPGEKIDFESSAVQAYLSFLADKREDYKDWLARQTPDVEVLREYAVVFNGLALKLNGVSAHDVAKGPHVQLVHFSRTFSPLMNLSHDLVGAPALWDAIGDPEGDGAGDGIKVGIIDTGIDIRQPFLSDEGFPSPSEEFPGSDERFTNNKVIVARVYCTACQGTTPGDIWSSHGTHVAGTVAGTRGTDGQVRGVTLTGLSGIAPRAWLGSYNVFPAGGVLFDVLGVGSAFEHDIVAAVEDAVMDGMDVLNLSLGGSPMPQDNLMMAVDAAVDAGLVVAVAAGNSGPGDSTISSPGTAPKVITAGASTNPHFVGLPVTVTGPGTVPSELMGVGAAVGDFNVPKEVTEAEYVTTEPKRACSEIENADEVAGKIALIERGDCFFTTKILNAEDADAIGVIVYNNVAGDPIAMGHFAGAGPLPKIFGVMVSNASGQAMVSFFEDVHAADGDPFPTVEVSVTLQEFVTENVDIIAGFSSRGPTMTHLRIKPDVTGPGVNVASSLVCEPDLLEDPENMEKEPDKCEFAFFSGTSMATPHVAGSSALLLEFHDDWSPQRVKSVLANTGDLVVTDHVTGEERVGVMTMGGGRLNLTAAAAVDTTIDPVSHSFGVVERSASFSVSKTFTITADEGVTFDTIEVGLVRTSLEDILSDVTDAPLKIEMGETGTVTLTLSRSQSFPLPVGSFEGYVFLNGTEGDGDSVSLHIPFWITTDEFETGASALSVAGAPGVSIHVGWMQMVAVATLFGLLSMHAVVRSHRRQQG